jgi:hypothetical protein
MEEQRDGVPSPLWFQESHKRNSSFPDNPKIVPWGMGTPGRVDHSIGVIEGKSRSRMPVPSLETIALFEISTDISSDNDIHNISMSSQLSPIPTDDESSINAFDS